MINNLPRIAIQQYIKPYPSQEGVKNWVYLDVFILKSGGREGGWVDLWAGNANMAEKSFVLTPPGPLSS